MHGWLYDLFHDLRLIKMLKKYIYILVGGFLLGYTHIALGCTFRGDVSRSLDNCFLDTDVVSPPGDLEVSQSGWFNEFLLLWIDWISWVLALAAVGVIAYGSLMFTLSAWEDDKITKGKDIIKWWILGFIAMILANALIELVINFLYDI